jgi:hypothetical protein
MAKRNIVPGDQIGNNLTGIARTCKTASKTLTGIGTRDEIIMPEGCYEVNIKSSAEVTFYEQASSVAESDGITYGTGYAGTNMTFPVWGTRRFWLEGDGSVSLLFSSIREV